MSELVALALYAGGLAVAFGVRTWLHRRRTGSSGFHGISGPPGSLSWCAGDLFVLALVLGIAAPILTLTGLVAAPTGTAVTAAAIAGVVLLALGVAGVVLLALGVAGVVLLALGVASVLVGQAGMGTSWRIGVDEAECTDLVIEGPLGIVRNPIFTAMALAQAGLVAAVPTLVAVVALVCLLLAIQPQVRIIEEPYLRRLHGEVYAAYAGGVGRFLPGIGRLVDVSAAR